MFGGYDWSSGLIAESTTGDIYLTMADRSKKSPGNKQLAWIFGVYVVVQLFYPMIAQKLTRATILFDVLMFNCVILPSIMVGIIMLLQLVRRQYSWWAVGLFILGAAAIGVSNWVIRQAVAGTV